MLDMIDGQLLVGIAALITSIANIIAALRRQGPPPDRPRSRRFPRRRIEKQNPGLRA